MHITVELDNYQLELNELLELTRSSYSSDSDKLANQLIS